MEGTMILSGPHYDPNALRISVTREYWVTMSLDIPQLGDPHPLYREGMEAGRREEREACAKLVLENLRPNHDLHEWCNCEMCDHLRKLALSIAARSN